ncbi:MAG: DnaJ domain-containing protein, partial [Alphaproteobacteria bacterium]|nr:DnaJ domain-containing protein [Alphaproteobacteria bacterium]
MSFKNVFEKKVHCQELGVPLNATLTQIKTAYRMLALRYHPDKNLNFNKPAATKKFLRVKAAYDYLQKHAENDDIFLIKKTFSENINSICENFINEVFSFNNFFCSSNFFNFCTAPPNNQPPIRHNLLLTFEEYLHGTVKKLLINPPFTAIQQQKKLLEVRVFAGATP